MKWFKKPKTAAAEIQVPPIADNRVEIEVEKNASKEAKQKANAVNAHVQELLEHNGFTVKIYLAAGGRLKHAEGIKGGNSGH